MYRKVFLLLVALVLGWFFGPLLSEIIALIPFKGRAANGLWEYVSTQGGAFYFEVIFWAVILWFLLPVVLDLFGFLTPQARRYSTTKLLRRLHWITAQFSLLFFCWLLSTLGLNLPGSKALEREARRMTELEMQQPSDALLDSSAGHLLNRLELDLYGSKPAEYSEALTNFLNTLTNTSIPIRSEFYQIERDFSADLSAWLEAAKRKTEARPNSQRVDPTVWKYAQMAVLGPYGDIRSNYVAVSSSLRKAKESMKARLEPGGEIYDQAYKNAQETIASWSFWKKFLLLPMKHFWADAFLLACGFLLMTNLFFRRVISLVHHAVMRFVEEGRFGQGGSGRFAGLFEEWGQISFHRGTTSFLKKALSPLGWGAAGERIGGWIEKARREIHVGRKPELFMGRSLYSPLLCIGLPDDRHMLTIAGSRTGKGATAIIPNLLLWEGSAIIIDPKGTNAVVTAEHRRRMGHKVHLVDPFGIVEKDETRRASFNPLEKLDPNGETIREDINVIADALVVPDQEQKEKHWDDGARTILGGLIGQLISDPEFKQPSLPMVRDLMNLSPDDQDELWASMSLNHGAGGAPSDAAARIIRGAKTNEITGLISNADKHSEWLSYPAIQKSLSHSTFSFAELKEQPTTVYLILPPHYLATHNRFLRLFINSAILQMAVGGRSKIPVLMILDEFLALGYMAEVEKAFGLMAGYNLVLWPFVQDLGRLKDLYKRSVNSFIANSRAVQIFGVADVETTEFVSKQLGNSSPSLLSTRGLSTLVPLRSPDEVAKDIVAESHRQYILRAGKAPLVLEKVAYHEGGLLDGWYPGLFAGKFGRDPDY